MGCSQYINTAVFFFQHDLIGHCALEAEAFINGPTRRYSVYVMVNSEGALIFGRLSWPL